MENVKSPMVLAKGGKRNTGLSIWLWLMVIGSVIGILSNFGSVFTGTAPGYENWSLIVLGILSVINLALIFLIFKWNIKGFHGIIVTATIAIIVNLTQGLGLFGILLGALGPVILYLFMRPQWKRFK